MKITSIKQRRKGSACFAVYMILGFGLLLIMSAASISFGAADMRIATAWEPTCLRA